MSRSSKSDIQKAITAKQTMIWKIFLCKNKHYIIVVLVPNFDPSPGSSSFFVCIFSSHVWRAFLRNTPYYLSGREHWEKRGRVLWGEGVGGKRRTRGQERKMMCMTVKEHSPCRTSMALWIEWLWYRFVEYGAILSSVRSLARSLAALTHSLTPQCSLRSRASLRSFVRSLTHSLTPALMGKRFLSMNWMRRFHIIWTHCASIRP